MNQTVNISQSKPHYEILDGLRGVAAIMVIFFHVFETFSNGDHTKQFINHGKRFASIRDYHELKIDEPENENGKQKIILFHYAMRTWNGSHRGVWQLYGHSHGTLPDDEMALSIDVGVDCHNFYPISYEEVKEIMKRKKWTPPFALRS